MSAQFVSDSADTSLESLQPDASERRWWIAALLSLVQVGLGQMYNGQPRKGLIWLGVTVAAGVAAIESFMWLPTLTLRLSVAGFLLVGPMTWAGLDAIWHARRQRETYRLRPYNKWYVYVLLMVVGQCMLLPGIVLGLREFQFQAFSIPSVSMRDALIPGDHALTDKLVYRFRDPRRGEIVVFAFPLDESKSYAQRIIGLPGETIEIRDRQVFLDGKPLVEPYKRLRRSPNRASWDMVPVRIPPGHYFVLGDNRDNSEDSRVWGTVERSKVKALFRTIYWSWDLPALEIRWHRIGQTVE